MKIKLPLFKILKCSPDCHVVVEQEPDETIAPYNHLAVPADQVVEVVLDVDLCRNMQDASFSITGG